MARYPAVPRLYNQLNDNPEVEQMYKDLEQWGAALESIRYQRCTSRWNTFYKNIYSCNNN